MYYGAMMGNLQYELQLDGCLATLQLSSTCVIKRFAALTNVFPLHFLAVGRALQ